MIERIGYDVVKVSRGTLPKQTPPEGTPPEQHWLHVIDWALARAESRRPVLCSIWDHGHGNARALPPPYNRNDLSTRPNWDLP
jgi:hypothetical protein